MTLTTKFQVSIALVYKVNIFMALSFYSVTNSSLLCNVKVNVILMVKRALVALLSLSSWCLVSVVWLYLAVP